MDLSIAAELCKRFEGFRSKPYLCPANVATIGYGSTYYANGTKVTLQDAHMSEPEAAVSQLPAYQALTELKTVSETVLDLKDYLGISKQDAEE